ncbi:TetR family transcriptional regulator [Streptomyces sp. NBC_00878]|uniref:TetR family transcriptional regulator n=1 Tax=Streptomyces sp. NBC_00878 TaxID=2975854 RepID=UPI0022513270|nr:TetR family transcriptional regulator [Streptomyces sp. NBC_00878]MCX4909145.1 TetR family transcriptional regulator [Streptomyces sp. NBC_00878]
MPAEAKTADAKTAEAKAAEAKAAEAKTAAKAAQPAVRAAQPVTPPLSPPLTERQEARRRRILHASAQLASRGGFDAVQMREVAESSQVALGTLYRYFPSKVHLLVATMQDQLAHMHGTLRKKPPTGDTAAERVAETLMRAFRALQREPHLADAMVRALTFADRSVSPEVDQVSRQTTVIILDAMGLDDPTPAQLSAVRVIEHTWHSALITWLSGRASIAQVKIDIETVCRLIDLTSTDD